MGVGAWGEASVVYLAQLRQLRVVGLCAARVVHQQLHHELEREIERETG